MRRSVVAVVLVGMSFGGMSQSSQAKDAPSSELTKEANPYLNLIRDPVVHKELGLGQRQVVAIRQLMDELDGPLISTRNKSFAEGRKILNQSIAKAKPTVNSVLSSSQQTRLNEIIVQHLGHRAVLFPDIVSPLRLTSDQTKKIHQIAKETDKVVADLQKQLRDSKSKTSIKGQLTKHRRDEKRKLLAVLTKKQKNRWKRMLGMPVDLTKLGQHVKLKAPEISGTNEWINSRPLKLEKMRGKVIALHFYAYG